MLEKPKAYSIVPISDEEYILYLPFNVVSNKNTYNSTIIPDKQNTKFINQLIDSGHFQNLSYNGLCGIKFFINPCYNISHIEILIEKVLFDNV